MTNPYDTGPDPTVKPGWVSDVPVEVDVHSLESFAKRIRDEVETNVVPNAASIQGRLAGEGSYHPAYDGYQGPPTYELGNNRTFGVDPRVPWASMLGYRHMSCERSAQELLAGLTRGMRAIADAAEAIATDYRSAEARNAMDVTRIGTYFIEPAAPASAGGVGDEPLDRNAAKAV
jgi:hypothetical protein